MAISLTNDYLCNLLNILSIAWYQEYHPHFKEYLKGGCSILSIFGCYSRRLGMSPGKMHS